LSFEPLGAGQNGVRSYPVRIEEPVIRVVAPEPHPDATIADRSGLLPPEETRQRLGQAVQQTMERVRSVVPAGRDGSGSSGED